MPAHLLVAGLDARSLLLEAPLLQRERHVVEERPSARDLMEDIPRTGARLVVLGPRLPDLGLPELSARIRASRPRARSRSWRCCPRTSRQDAETAALEAGANAVAAAAARPRDELETWLAKLLIVPRRVEARIPVQGHVVGTPRTGEAVPLLRPHPQPERATACCWPARCALPFTPDLDLEFNMPGVIARLQALGRVVREAGEVEWPYLGYGVEFLFVPPDSQEALAMLVSGRLPRRPRPRPTRAGHPLHASAARTGSTRSSSPSSTSRRGRRRSAARRASSWRPGPGPARSTWSRAARARACCARRRPSSRAIRIRARTPDDNSPQSTEGAEGAGSPRSSRLALAA